MEETPQLIQPTTGHHPPSPPGQQQLRRSGLIWLAAILLFTLLPLPLAIWQHFGDDDAAWDGVVAILWARQGHLPVENGLFVQERFRSSPLSIYLLQALIRSGGIEADQAPLVINITTITAGLLLPVLFFLLLRTIFSQNTAGIATLLLLFSPVYFRLRCYGLPTVPSLLLFLLGLWAYYHAMSKRRGVTAWLAAAFALLCAAVLMKVDVILLAPMLVLMPLLHREHPNRHTYAVGAIMMSLVALFIWHLFCSLAQPHGPSTFIALQHWTEKWTISPAGLFDRRNLLNMMMAFGAGTAAALLVLLVYGLYHKSTRKAVWFLLFCLLPTLLFWGMRDLNSSRHSFWMVIPAVVFIGWIIAQRLTGPVGKVGLVLLVCLMNYLIGPAREDYRMAAARFISSARQRQALVRTDAERYRLAFSQAPQNSGLCFYPIAEPTARLIATAVQWAGDCNVRVGDPDQNEWHLELYRHETTASAVASDRPDLRVWIPEPRQPLEKIWPRIRQEGWILLLPNEQATEPPFFHLSNRRETTPSVPADLDKTAWP